MGECNNLTPRLRALRDGEIGSGVGGVLEPLSPRGHHHAALDSDIGLQARDVYPRE